MTKVITITTVVQEKTWAPGDTYLVIPEIQVFKYDGLKEGDKVRVTIEKFD